MCVDSDGCAIDSMESKHRECFGPALIDTLGLINMQEEVMDLWLHINLYSKWRGINRYQGFWQMIMTLKKRYPKQELSMYDAFGHWVETTHMFSMDALKQEMEKNHDLGMKKVHGWSRDVNNRIETMQKKSKLFEHVQPCLRAMSKHADIFVVSSANHDAIDKEWKALGIAPFVQLIGGQEYGKKEDFIKGLIEQGYDANQALMIGDAPGDMRAAAQNHIRFYPIQPQDEGWSWRMLKDKIFEELLYNHDDSKDYLEAVKRYKITLGLE